MLIAEAQREVRTVYRAGAVGLFVSAALTTWASPRSGMLAIGLMFLALPSSARGSRRACCACSASCVFG